MPRPQRLRDDLSPPPDLPRSAKSLDIAPLEAELYRPSSSSSLTSPSPASASPRSSSASKSKVKSTTASPVVSPKPSPLFSRKNRSPYGSSGSNASSGAASGSGGLVGGGRELSATRSASDLLLMSPQEDTPFERDLRDILEGDGWALVAKDFPRLAHRIEISDDVAGVTVVRESDSVEGAWRGKGGGVKEASSSSGNVGADGTLATVPTAGEIGENQPPQQDITPAPTPIPSIPPEPIPSTQSPDSSAASTILLDLARRLEPPETLAALQEALAPTLTGTTANGKEKTKTLTLDARPMQHILEKVLTPASRTARLLRSINQAIILSGTWYIYQNVMSVVGLMTKDVRGPEGWRIRIHFHGNSAIF
ncbi:hypothetical protein HK102_006470, partial [Quaeritorhiza haematococci]